MRTESLPETLTHALGAIMPPSHFAKPVFPPAAFTFQAGPGNRQPSLSPDRDDRFLSVSPPYSPPKPSLSSITGMLSQCTASEAVRVPFSLTGRTPPVQCTGPMPAALTKASQSRVLTRLAPPSKTCRQRSPGKGAPRSRQGLRHFRVMCSLIIKGN